MSNRKLVELLIEEGGDAFGVEAISLVKFPAIESNFVFFSKDKGQKMLSLAVLDEDKRTLIGAALIPDKHIPRYDEFSDEEYDVFFSKETVKLASELFLKTNRTNSHTFEHQDAVDGVSVVESWIVDNPEMDKSAHYGMSLPEGTWAVRVHVANDDMWKSVKEGTIRGFSIEGYFLDSLQEMSTKVEKPGVKETLSRLWAFIKRKFYAEIKLENGSIIATEGDALAAGVEVFTLDEEGLPIEFENGKYKTEGGIELEVFEGVLIEYDGEVKEVEEKIEEVAKEEVAKAEMSSMKISYWKNMLDGRVKQKFGSYRKFRILKGNKTKPMKKAFNSIHKNKDLIDYFENFGTDYGNPYGSHGSLFEVEMYDDYTGDSEFFEVYGESEQDLSDDIASLTEDDEFYMQVAYIKKIV